MNQPVANDINADNYIQNVLRSESCDYEAIKNRTAIKTYIRLDHAAKGMCTEAGEFTDTLKKYAFYGKEVDRVNLVEEIGDLLWYVALALDELDSSFQEVMQINISKLRKRYPEKFTEHEATNRDLEAEREILESGTIKTEDGRKIPPPQVMRTYTFKVQDWIHEFYRVDGDRVSVQAVSLDSALLTATKQILDGALSRPTNLDREAGRVQFLRVKNSLEYIEM